MGKKLLRGAKLSKHLDQLVRDYFKLEYGDNPQCLVCDRFGFWFHPKKHPKGMQVGHYVSRTYNILRWDLKNVFPQCSSCNRVHNINPAPFTIAIINKIGVDRIVYLNRITREWKGKTVRVSMIRQFQINLEAEIEKLTNSSLNASM